MEFFGNARPIEEAKATTGSFSGSVGTQSAQPGDQVWLSADFGVLAPYRFPPSVNTRITDVTVASNDVDISCAGKYRIHYVTRNDNLGGDILLRVAGYRAPGDYVYATTEGSAPITPSNVVESYNFLYLGL